MYFNICERITAEPIVKMNVSVFRYGFLYRRKIKRITERRAITYLSPRFVMSNIIFVRKGVCREMILVEIN